MLTMSERKKKPKPPRRSVTYRLPEPLLDAIDRLTEETRRTATAEFEIALEKHLKEHNLWPPPEPDATSQAKKK